MKVGVKKASLLAATLAAVVAVASCQAPAPPPPPPAPPPPPPTALSTDVVQAAANYRHYMRLATALAANFADGDQVQSELRAGESYEPHQLARGMVGYAAVLALQEPAFIAGVRQYSKDPAQRAEIVGRIFADPAYAGQMPGADAAAGAIIAHLTTDGAALNQAGVAIKQAAYDIQHQPWSLRPTADREGRLATAKSLSGASSSAVPEEASALLQAALSGQGGDAGVGPARPPYTEAVIRGLAIAALAVLGAAGDDHTTQIVQLMDEGVGPTCLNMSKLNLYQCLSVARPQYEDVFCLGQHGLMDTGRCVQKVVGTAPADVIETARPQGAIVTAAQTTAHKRRSHSRRK